MAFSSLWLNSPCFSSGLRFNVHSSNAPNKFAGVKVPVCRASSVVFQNLNAEDYMHPLDKQNTRMLKAVPGLTSKLGKILRKSIYEKPISLEDIGESEYSFVSPNKLPGLHKLLVEAAEILSMDVPFLYVCQNSDPSAWTVTISDKWPYIVVHTGIVELLTQQEMQDVLAHELGHIKCDHYQLLSYGSILSKKAKAIPGLGWLIAESVDDKFIRWREAAELSADRASLLVAQDLKVVISVLMKLGSPSLADQLNTDTFLKQARAYDIASSTPAAWDNTKDQMMIRAKEIDEWSRSQQYKALLRSAIEKENNTLMAVDT